MQHGLIASFALWGGMTGGVPAGAMDPGSVMQQGFALAGVLLAAVANGSWLQMAANMTVTILCGIAIILCFALVGIILLETLIEGYVACTAGTVLVAMSGSRFTHRFAERYFGWALGIAIRLFFLYLILGLGYQLVTRWQAAAQSHSAEILTNILLSGRSGNRSPDPAYSCRQDSQPRSAACRVHGQPDFGRHRAWQSDQLFGPKWNQRGRRRRGFPADRGTDRRCHRGRLRKGSLRASPSAADEHDSNGHDGNHGGTPTQPLKPGDFGQQTQRLNDRGSGGRP